MLFPKDFRKVQVMLLLLPFMLRQALVTSYTYETLKVPRSKRYLVYPPAGEFAPTKVQLIIGLGLPMEVEVSTVMGYVLKFNFNLPSNASELTNPYVRYARSRGNKLNGIENYLSVTNSKDDDKNYETLKITRYDLYKMILMTVDSFHFDKACLLKIICEVAEVPFNNESGIFAELLHIFITPSTTSEQINDPTDREYLAAEILGRSGIPGQCTNWFPECNNNILEYFTEILFY